MVDRTPLQRMKLLFREIQGNNLMKMIQDFKQESNTKITIEFLYMFLKFQPKRAPHIENFMDLMYFTITFFNGSRWDIQRIL